MRQILCKTLVPGQNAILLFAVGLISILGQVILLRELNVAFFGTELIIIFSLGLWLFWTAIGALLQKYAGVPSPIKIALSLAALGLLIFADVAFIRGSRILFGGIPGAYLPFPRQLLVAALALFPVSFLTGLLFSWSAKLFISESTFNRTLFEAYALESAGGLLGGLLPTLFLHWGIQNLQSAVLCFILSLPTLFLPAVRPSGRWMIRGYAPAFFLILCSLAWTWPFGTLDTAMTRWNHPHVLASKDTPYGRITLTGLSGQISLFENDALYFETEGTDAEAFVHPALLQHPGPKHILVLGGGAEGLVEESLHHRPERIDYVELNPEMLKIVLPYMPGSIRESLYDPRVRIIFADPRQYLNNSVFYDVILVGMPEPVSGETNRFYSREFFRQCAMRLNPQGILCLRLKAAENFWTPPMALRIGSIYQALRTVFPECVLLPGPSNVITASSSALPVSPETPIERWNDRKIKSSLINAPYLFYIYENDRFLDFNNRLEKTEASSNTDIRPVCYRFSILVWLAKFFPDLNTFAFHDPFRSGETKDRLPFVILFATFLIIFSLSRYFPTVRRSILMAAAGFVGMVLEMVLLLHYQIKNGVLYQDIGVLLTSFMAGLTLGAMIFHRRKPNQAWGFGLVIGFFILTVIVYHTITLDRSFGLIPTMALLCCDALFVSAVFAFSSIYEIADQSAIVSSLYAADLFGGCLGALVSGLLLIPFFGLDITTAFMIMIIASLLVMVA
ncbi:MAG: hypothetical protein PHN75_03190 [Syntrophales bacterium]|nr:hypothetical protein [Syntrophales bacterium]